MTCRHEARHTWTGELTNGGCVLCELEATRTRVTRIEAETVAAIVALLLAEADRLGPSISSAAWRNAASMVRDWKRGGHG